MASNSSDETLRYFLTYRGVSLPLTLSGELDEAAIGNRGTFFRAYYDARGRLVRVEKVVYGEIELEHIYEYDNAGRLAQARITLAGEETQCISFAAHVDG